MKGRGPPPTWPVVLGALRCGWARQGGCVEAGEAPLAENVGL